MRGDFTPQAEAYARARPGYPAELVDRLLSTAGVKPGQPVADLGAGTGLFTALLAARGLAVVAVEPSAAMRQRGVRPPGVVWLDGTFEATSLPTASQLWAVAAQAFHWADPPRAIAEVHRILAPGACFTVLWNVRDLARSQLLRQTHQLVELLAAGFDEGYRDRDWGGVLTADGRFAAVESVEVPHVVEMGRARYLDLWRSHHLLAQRAGEEGVAKLVAQIEPLLPRRGDVPVPYLCRAWTVRRVG